MLESIAFLVRVQCRRKESSRSLSHLLMSFMFFMSQITRLTDRRTDGQTESLDRVCISCSELKKYQNQLTAGTPRPGSRLFAKPHPRSQHSGLQQIQPLWPKQLRAPKFLLSQSPSKPCYAPVIIVNLKLEGSYY